jgi:hypothetical protein
MNAPAKIETGIVDIRGKQYETVALRVQKFRAAHPDKSLTTEMIARDDECVVMRAVISAEDGRVLATGHSEEYRKASQINRTSALENAETSAIGRALAAYGFGGTEFATANEVANAIHQQGAGGQRQGGTVSPQPPKQPAHSALKTKLRAFVHELNGCGDGDELSAFLATADSVKLVNETREKLPHLWDGSNWPEGTERPEEFVPLADLITRRQRECAEASAQYLNA